MNLYIDSRKKSPDDHRNIIISTIKKIERDGYIISIIKVGVQNEFGMYIQLQTHAKKAYHNIQYYNIEYRNFMDLEKSNKILRYINTYLMMLSIYSGKRLVVCDRVIVEWGRPRVKKV